MPVYAQIDDGSLTQFVGIAESAKAAHLAAHPGCLLLPMAILGTPASHWFDPADGTVKARQTMTLGVAGPLITGLPAGAMLSIDGTGYGPIDDGEADLDLPPGTYRIEITAAGYVTERIEVVAP